ncbi:MAG: UDP-glucose 4-epimerase GalE [Alphaproteobacteria bacterium]
MPETVLVTGGAGYIGSHVVRQLVAAGHDVVVYDNLSTGRREAVLGASLVVGDLADEERLRQLFDERRFAAVLHFAASIVVPESVAHPLDYYSNNTANTLRLVRCCAAFGVERFVFSSTAAVYGEPPDGGADETAPTSPINPYGASKLMSEWILRDHAASSGFRHVTLRYFNAAGADFGGRIGQSFPGATHLIKVACEAIVGVRPSVTIFGTDYDTPDGTGIRDYIHVEDLARAHLDALSYLESGGESVVLNCGYGKGYSVREVLDCVMATADATITVNEGERRAGDPPRLVANSKRIRSVLGWTPQHDDLETIVATALAWERKLAGQ